MTEFDDATWARRFFNTNATWTVPGGDFAATPTAVTILGSSGTTAWSGSGLVAEVQAWIDNLSQNFGWILVGNETLDKTARRFFAAETAAETAAVDVRPTLRFEVMLILEPSTYALIGLGLSMVGFALKRQARKGRLG